jgi:hypothetical protein
MEDDRRDVSVSKEVAVYLSRFLQSSIWLSGRGRECGRGGRGTHKPTIKGYVRQLDRACILSVPG